MLNKYSVPENSKQLTITRATPAVWRASSPHTRKNDLKLQHIQKLLVTSLRPLAILFHRLLTASNMLGNTNLNEVLNCFSDTIALICSANREIKLKMRDQTQPDLKSDYKLLCTQQVSITQFLFGDILFGDMSEIIAASKLTQSLAKTKSSYSRSQFSIGFDKKGK